MQLRLREALPMQVIGRFITFGAGLAGLLYIASGVAAPDGVLISIFGPLLGALPAAVPIG